ncbi:hypothetical protein ADA01nite_17610 [Aneurinibacillus danicus]|uniref:SpoVT-AbrB domain-containing protein n=1 Tax=Aneurinibacillus danicus TaxID=267746 RepID=A0A511V802_9BACL|nr:hypothetical protein ADA01nite_17610 [Aneurinibacillus danicus]
MVIPIELRRNLGIMERDGLEISVNEENRHLVSRFFHVKEIVT